MCEGFVSSDVHHSACDQTWGQLNFGIDGQFPNWNCLFKKNGIGIDKLELTFATK